jgi:hypothetical protein
MKNLFINKTSRQKQLQYFHKLYSLMIINYNNIWGHFEAMQKINMTTCAYVCHNICSYSIEKYQHYTAPVMLKL